MNYRQGHPADLEGLKQLAIKSWAQFQNELMHEHWETLSAAISNTETYSALLEKSHCFVCETPDLEIIGMAFLVPKGNPTEIYDEQWSYIRFVSVDPAFGGHGIGTQLTQKCIDFAKENNEQIIALHTSEIMSNARHIYERLGFQILREIEPRFGKKYWLYLLDLSTETDIHLNISHEPVSGNV